MSLGLAVDQRGAGKGGGKEVAPRYSHSHFFSIMPYFFVGLAPFLTLTNVLVIYTSGNVKLTFDTLNVSDYLLKN